MANENHETVVNSDAVDRAKEEVSWELNSIHYGYSGDRIAMLRALEWGDDHYIVQVLDLPGKKAKVIAECDIRNGQYGRFFTTTPGDWGHEALCRLLLKNGIGGRYKTWLKAKDDGNDELAREYQDSAYIRFSLEPTGETEDQWTIDTTIQDPTAAADAA